MPNIQFGSGVLYGKPVAGNLPTNPTPWRIGALQEADVTFKGDLKKLYGQGQFPIATARGKVDVMVKGKFAIFDPNVLNQLYFAQSAVAGILQVVDQESHLIPANLTALNITKFAIASNMLTFTVVNSATVGEQFTIAAFPTSTYLNAIIFTVTAATGTTMTGAFTHSDVALTTEAGTATPLLTVAVANAANFLNPGGDEGVQYSTGPSAGGSLLKVPSAPAVGQYSVNEATGVYSFAAADEGNTVLISYGYNNAARGTTVTISQQLMGYAPEIEMFLYSFFRGKYLGLKLYDVTLGHLGIPTKLEDFWLLDFDGSANANAANLVASLYLDNQ